MLDCLGDILPLGLSLESFERLDSRNMLDVKVVALHGDKRIWVIS